MDGRWTDQYTPCVKSPMYIAVNGVLWRYRQAVAALMMGTVWVGQCAGSGPRQGGSSWWVEPSSLLGPAPATTNKHWAHLFLLFVRQLSLHAIYYPDFSFFNTTFYAMIQSNMFNNYCWAPIIWKFGSLVIAMYCGGNVFKQKASEYDCIFAKQTVICYLRLK